MIMTPHPIWSTEHSQILILIGIFAFANFAEHHPPIVMCNAVTIRNLRRNRVT